MLFKNTRKGPIIGTDVQIRDDEEIVNLGCETRFVQPGKTGEFNPASPAVKIYAKAGYLVPIDREGKAWLKELLGK